MDKIQQCAKNFTLLVEKTKYVFHTSINKKVSIFELDFKETDFHHAIGLQYLHDINIPKNKSKTLSWILNEEKPITDDFLSKDSNYRGKVNQERDIELRISEFRFLEEYLEQENIVYIYSPKDSPCNNSIIPCDYIIKSHSAKRGQTVFIFLKHREGENSACGIMSFGVKKNVEYGGMYQYVMLKDKIVNGIRENLYKHPRYTVEQILAEEPSIEASYIDTLLKHSDKVNTI